MDLNTLKIGCIVAVTLSSSNRLIGEFNGYKEEPHAIVLKNVRFWQKEGQTSSKSYLKCHIVFGELLVESQHILKLDIMEDDKPQPSVGLVNRDSTAAVEKSMLPLHRASQCKVPSLSWLPGSKPLHFLYKADVRKEMQQSMQDYCKKLFDNTNFVQLIPSIGAQPKSLVGMALPDYFARFYREPVISIECQAETSSKQQHQELVSLHQELTETPSVIKMQAENAIKNNELFEENACAMIISELLNNAEDNNDPIITVHQLNCEMSKLNLHDPVAANIPKPMLSDLSHYRLSPFLRYSNGHLYLNETFYNTLLQPMQTNETKENESLCVENSNNIAMDYQAIED